ncbi:MAG: hypothetical protein K6T61_17490 [Bryobacteraceae bacterium]|nr:hypothetical protein [Bryobacteraceae bacterium]
MDAPASNLWPPLLEVEGDSHGILVDPDARLDARIIVKGQRNRLIIGGGAMIVAFAPAGFAATVPEAGETSSYSITIDGDDNVVEIGAGTKLGVNATFRGDRNVISIGDACHLHGFVNVLCSDAYLKIGRRTTMVQGSIQLHEPGSIVFGEDCMISSQVYVSLSDIHPIYDRASGQRLNPAASVTVGDHVWMGLRCLVMKGTEIGDGSVIAAGAIVSGEVPPNTIVAGVPARVVRQDIEWRRDFSQGPPEPIAKIVDRPARWKTFWRPKLS